MSDYSVITGSEDTLLTTPRVQVCRSFRVCDQGLPWKHMSQLCAVQVQPAAISYSTIAIAARGSCKLNGTLAQTRPRAHRVRHWQVRLTYGN